MKTCKKCNITLEVGVNIHPSMFNNKDYRCKTCFNKQINKSSLEKKYYSKINNKWNPSVYGIFEKGICLYIGQSTQPYARFKNHKSAINNINKTNLHKNLYTKLQAHTSYVIGIIEECSREVLLEREQHYINTKKPLYNNIKE